MTIEQALLRAYTDAQFRQSVLNGTEKLENLSAQELAAFKAVDFDALTLDANSSGVAGMICIDRR